MQSKYRRKVKHTVAAIDIKYLRDGSKLVCGVVFAVAIDVVFKAVVAYLLAAKNFGAQVVHVTALAMNYLTEKSLLDHVHSHHFKSAVAAVFEEHKGSFCSHLSFYKVESLLYIVSTANLKSCGNACLHCFAGDLNVALPAGHNKYCIY